MLSALLQPKNPIALKMYPKRHYHFQEINCLNFVFIFFPISLQLPVERSQVNGTFEGDEFDPELNFFPDKITEH